MSSPSFRLAARTDQVASDDRALIRRLVDRVEGGPLERRPVRRRQIAAERGHLAERDPGPLGQLDVLGPLVTPVEAVRRAQNDDLAQTSRKGPAQQRSAEAQPASEQIPRGPGQRREDVHRFFGAARGTLEHPGQDVVPLLAGQGLDAGRRGGGHDGIVGRGRASVAPRGQRRGRKPMGDPVPGNGCMAASGRHTSSIRPYSTASAAPR